LLTRPTSGEAASAASAARMATASSAVSPTIATTRGADCAHDIARWSHSITTTVSPVTSSRSTIARPTPRPPPVTT
jgi:hypothetical protein